MEITAIYVYPVKALGGISLQTAELSDAGILYDRQWMLVRAEDGTFLTQRDLPQLCLFQTAFAPEGVEVAYKGESVVIPYERAQGAGLLPSAVWGHEVMGQLVSEEINHWFSKHLGLSVYLLRMASERFDSRHAEAKVGFADSCQYLVIGEASLEFLNGRLDQPVGMDRFRPNIVFSGGEAHEEDAWLAMQVGNSAFEAIKSCARCQVIAIDQRTGIAGKEPLKTLSKYRSADNKVFFGRYFRLAGERGVIEVGQRIMAKK